MSKIGFFLFQIVFLNNAKILIMFMQLLQHQSWKVLWRGSTVSIPHVLLCLSPVLRVFDESVSVSAVSLSFKFLFYIF